MCSLPRTYQNVNCTIVVSEISCRDISFLLSHTDWNRSVIPGLRAAGAYCGGDSPSPSGFWEDISDSIAAKQSGKVLIHDQVREARSAVFLSGCSRVFWSLFRSARIASLQSYELIMCCGSFLVTEAAISCWKRSSKPATPFKSVSSHWCLRSGSSGADVVSVVLKLWSTSTNSRSAVKPAKMRTVDKPETLP